jgi:hypothetical protein
MRSTVRYLRAAIPAALLLAGTLALSHPASASASAAVRSADASPAAASPAAARGGNLLVNPRATAGDVSAQGWDAVTIPGWQVAAGLPTVVRPGTSGFPAAPGGPSPSAPRRHRLRRQLRVRYRHADHARDANGGPGHPRW